MQPRFVFFDLGNVLVHFDHELAVQNLAGLSGRSDDTVREVVFTSQLQNAYERGSICCTDFAERVNQGLHTRLAATDILEAISAIFQPNESMLPVLERLRSEGVSMGLLSNTCAAHWTWIQRQGWPIPGQWFALEVLSYQLQCMKPEAGIYQFCERRCGRLPSDLFFVDDRRENIAAAGQRGWETHLYKSPAELTEHLERWLQVRSAP